MSTSTRASTLGWCSGWSFPTRTVLWGRRRPARGHPVRELRQCRPQLGPLLLEGVHRRECGARVLQERRGPCPGGELPERGQHRRLPQAGKARQLHPPCLEKPMVVDQTRMAGQIRNVLGECLCLSIFVFKSVLATAWPCFLAQMCVETAFD